VKPLSPGARTAVEECGPLARLTVDGVRLGLDVEVARTLRRRTVGLLGRRAVPVALLLHPCSSVHSLGMLVDLEVAYLDRDLRVLEVVGLPRWRVHVPRRGAVAVLETAAGELTRLGVRTGRVLGLERARPR
jgi:uncharacterized membrane protein (UPF0127 family)